MPDVISPQVLAARVSVSQLLGEREKFLQDAGRLGQVDTSALKEIDDRIGALLDHVLPLVDPCDASATEPLVLLPVRLETRFGTDGAGAAVLRVRIYPDEIHVDDLVRGLTENEVTAGRAYWNAAWTDPVPEGAWPAFVGQVGAHRAEWVAHVSTPTNLAARGTGAPAFAEIGARGTRNVVARSLPDRFVVVVVQGGHVSQAVGRPVPADLPLSPIALEGDTPTRSREALTVPPGSEWLIDFQAAVDVGMGVIVPLVGSTAPIDRVLAVGTRSSLSASAGADELEDLFTGHRFGAGLSLLPQGTPTNNSDAGRSPYRSRSHPAPPPLTVAVPTAESDTAAAAHALGIDAALLTDLVGDGTGERTIARLVNTAVWAPGWGAYLSRLDEQGVPGVVDAQRESARELFRDQVRGRGPAPAMRVGAQPYGVLTVSDLHRWQPRTGETTAGIAGVVRSLLPRWLYAAARKVPVVRPGQPNLDQAFLDVLGSSPVMQGLRVRPVLSDDVSAVVLASLGLDHREYEAEKMSMSAVGSALFGVNAAAAIIGSLHDETRPLPLPLASDRDPEFIAALLGTPSRVLAIDSVLQALLALAMQSTDLDVALVSPASVVPSLLELVVLEPELTARVSAMVSRAHTASSADVRAIVGEMQAAGVVPGGPSLLRKYQPFAQIQTSLAEVALSAPVTDDARELSASVLAGWLHAMGYRSEVREAMTGLMATTVEDRRLAVAEALDCSSHRLDAWATAIVAQRRAQQVAGGAARGVTIGAYGVVEDLSPQDGAAADGWIHAPSARHAVAAGMLRSAHLNHLPAGGGGGPFAIDLSSRRLQSASHVIEGVRAGQQLGALVGYQIERGLAEVRLARLQLSLRTIAPLVAGRLHDADGADSRAAQESVAANNVVDGVLLLKKHQPDDPALRAALDKEPENVYLEPGQWTPLTEPEWGQVTTILRAAADTIDAVADVMLSESVLQFANGNPHRAAAAMDAMSTGASPSDTIDVLEAQDSAERLTHRVLGLVSGDAPATSWNAGRPRALAEPRLEAWAAAHLGPPTDIVVAVVDGQPVTLDAAGFAALDLVHGSDLAALERTLRQALPQLAGVDLAVLRDPGWGPSQRALGQVAVLASTLRGLLAGSHALLPADITRPGEQPARTLEPALPELTGRVTDLVASFHAAIAGLAATVAGIPADGIVSSPDEAAAVTAAAYELEPFGTPLQPNADLPLDVSWVRAAWGTAQARSVAAQTALDQLTAPPVGTPAHLLLETAQEAVDAVFGATFLVVPVLAPAADGFAAAVTAPAFGAPSRSAVRRFVRDVATVRPQVTRLSEALLLGGAIGVPRDLSVAQLSERAAPTDPAGVAVPGTDRWLAGPLPPEGPWPATPVAHLVLDTVGTVDVGSAIAGFAVDAWVEDVPAQVGPKADASDPRPGRARTGLAIRSNSASARPPQTVLSAISPDGQRWTVESVRGVVEHALELARARMVTLERLAGDGLVLPALYMASSALQGQEFLSYIDLSELKSLHVAMPYVKETHS